MEFLKPAKHKKLLSGSTREMGCNENRQQQALSALPEMFGRHQSTKANGPTHAKKNGCGITLSRSVAQQANAMRTSYLLPFKEFTKTARPYDHCKKDGKDARTTNNLRDYVLVNNRVNVVATTLASIFLAAVATVHPSADRGQIERQSVLKQVAFTRFLQQSKPFNY